MPPSDEKLTLDNVELAEVERVPSKSNDAFSTFAQAAIDPAAEKRLLRKFDLIMLPLFTLICA